MLGYDVEWEKNPRIRGDQCLVNVYYRLYIFFFSSSSRSKYHGYPWLASENLSISWLSIMFGNV